MPFVRLALARYQPRSIDGVELSEVVLADFAQLTPDRSAALTVDPADPLAARLVVGGLAPTGPTRSLIEVTVEARRPHVAGRPRLGPRHRPRPSASRRTRPRPASPTRCSSAARSASPSGRRPGQFRVAIREFEILSIDPPTVALDRQPASRLPAGLRLDPRARLPAAALPDLAGPTRPLP